MFCFNPICHSYKLKWSKWHNGNRKKLQPVSDRIRKLPKEQLWHDVHLYHYVNCVKTGSELPSNSAWIQQPNWRAERSLSLSLSRHNRCFSHSLYVCAASLFQLNNKKLFSLACYLTAVLWIDGCVHARAWQLLCTPNEFNHRGSVSACH